MAETRWHIDDLEGLSAFAVGEMEKSTGGVDGPQPLAEWMSRVGLCNDCFNAYTMKHVQGCIAYAYVEGADMETLLHAIFTHGFMNGLSLALIEKEASDANPADACG